MVNRGVLIVRPKRPYLDWANELDDSGLLPDPNGEQTVYLIPRFETDEEALTILKRPAGKPKSVALTDEGLRESERLFNKLFSKP